MKELVLHLQHFIYISRYGTGTYLLFLVLYYCCITNSSSKTGRVVSFWDNRSRSLQTKRAAPQHYKLVPGTSVN